MKRKKIRWFLGAILLIVLVAGLVWYRLVRVQLAAILIETDPIAEVFINGEQLGKTPFEAELEESEVVIKLVPESFERPLLPYETKVRLTPGVKTIVRRQFGEREEKSSGVEISFEKMGGKNASLAVVTIPDGAEVWVDQSQRELSPIKLNELVVGRHEVKVKADGYFEKSFSVQTEAGYGVTAIVELAKDETAEAMVLGEEEKSESPTTVEILETPTGFLRVRSEPSTESEEVAQVEPGEHYPLLEEDGGGEWYKINYEDELGGWVSGEYVSKSSAVNSDAAVENPDDHDNPDGN